MTQQTPDLTEQMAALRAWAAARPARRGTGTDQPDLFGDVEDQEQQQ